MASDGEQEVVTRDPLIILEHVEKGQAGAGPRTMPTATARFTVAIGFGAT